LLIAMAGTTEFSAPDSGLGRVLSILGLAGQARCSGGWKEGL
jgi:hypothetical protein